MNTTRVGFTFAAITVAKISAFLILLAVGRAAPFIGDNAIDHYIPAAHRLLTEGRFNGPDSRVDSKVPPGYSALLAATMAIAPERFATVTVCVQMLADLVTALLLFWIGRTFVGLAEGALAGVVWLLYPPEVALSTWITAETVFTMVFIGGLALVLSSLQSGRQHQSLFAGVLLGIATLLRGTPIGIPVMLLPLAIWRRAYLWAALLVTGFVLVVAPWAIRNRIVLNDPIVVAVGFGGAFLQGSDERVFTIDGKRVALPELYGNAAKAGILKPTSDHEGGIDSWMFAVGMHRYKERLATDPWSFVPFMAKKSLLLWYSTESGSFRGQFLLGLFSLPIVLPGLIRTWRWAAEGTMFGVVCGIVLSYFILLHMATGPLNRYMLPIYPLLCLAASSWALDLIGARSRVGALPVERLAEVQE